jgi:hypothetical protein
LGMMTTFQGFCTPESSLGVGTDENAFECFDPQATIHMPWAETLKQSSVDT